MVKEGAGQRERSTLEASLASSNLPASTSGVRKRGSPTEIYTSIISMDSIILGPSSGPNVGALLAGGNIALNGFLAWTFGKQTSLAGL